MYREDPSVSTIQQLQARRRLEFCDDVKTFTQSLCSEYLDFPDTTTFEHALHDCEVLLQSVQGLRKSLQRGRSSSSQLTDVKKLEQDVGTDLGVLEDAWYFVSQGPSALRNALNSSLLLCMAT